MQELANTPSSQLPPVTAVPQPVATPLVPDLSAADLDAFANGSSESSDVAPSLTSGSASVSTRNSAASLGDQSLYNDVLNDLVVDQLFDGLLVDIVNELYDELTNELAGEPTADELAEGLAYFELLDKLDDFELLDELAGELAGELADGE